MAEFTTNDRDRKVKITAGAVIAILIAVALAYFAFKSGHSSAGTLA